VARPGSVVHVWDLGVSSEDQRQTRLINSVREQFSRFPEVVEIHLRGSFAKDAADDYSDVDVVVVVWDDALENFFARLNESVAKMCDLVYAGGWLDRFVPDFGGLGFVYLCTDQGRLVQLDLYVVPASWSRGIREFPQARSIFARASSGELDERWSTKQQLAAVAAARDMTVDVALECLVVALVWGKQIARSTVTLASRYRAALGEAIAGLIRAAYAPDRIAFRMYDWDNDLGPARSLELVRSFERWLERAEPLSVPQLRDAMSLVRELATSGPLEHRLAALGEALTAVEDELETTLSAQFDANMTST